MQEYTQSPDYIHSLFWVASLMSAFQNILLFTFLTKPQFYLYLSPSTSPRAKMGWEFFPIN